jgi:hypothetical protein
VSPWPLAMVARSIRYRSVRNRSAWGGGWTAWGWRGEDASVDGHDPGADVDPAADLSAEVVACAERTLGSAGVKVEWRDDLRLWHAPRRRRRRGGLLAPVFQILGAAVRAAWSRATDDLQFGRLQAKGILEPRTGRYMLDFGSFAQLTDDGQRYSGRSGRPIATLHPDPNPPNNSGEMRWLLALLRGATDATLEGQDVLHGTSCRRIAVSLDLPRASAAINGGLAAPAVDRFEQLTALPATVWIDAQHIRRVQLRQPESRERTLELWDYGLATEEFDWSRLPTFRSPGEAAVYAGETVPWYRRLRSMLHLG